ncbi:pantoate--beta-alanine ligase [Nitrospirillum viridazoti]|uniref:Pantothenate synthetase n=2 Tax=Nitrospirillum TaxID=1543705 RepID=A0A560HTH1_9PROT|nr:pantoate--beta-alanine ligase [Nitrospirillum amazonense]TWB49906.1 pantoate--beta-alanine ligase [Nitrospirillum amazonense]
MSTDTAAMAPPPASSSTGPLAIVRTPADLRARVAAWRKEGLRVGLVPTMGALHEGHLTLVKRARELADRVVASVFVNPTQFGPNEDFSRYPRDEAGDARLLAGAGCDLLYAPGVEAIYPPGFTTTVDVGPVAVPLEGHFRPGHFQGVATVVTKLLLQALPDVACFGQKDYQQLAVIRRLAADLDIPVRIEGVPTVREADGLALSSRNRYLSAEERQQAVTISRVLNRLRDTLGDGSQPVAPAITQATEALTAAGFTRIDYVAVVDAGTLAPLERVDRPARALVAAFLGRTRLIDNLALGPDVP